MKHGTPGHIKMRRLARLLEIPRLHAVGMMAALWDAVPNFAPAGDVGRLSDREIADVLDWPGDPGSLVAALVTAGWLDRDSKYRLVVHDWNEHAQAWVKKRAKDRGFDLLHRGNKKPFNVESDKVSTGSQQSLDPVLTKLTLPLLSLPPLSSPSLSSPPLPPTGGVGVPKSDDGPPGFARFWGAWPAHERKSNRRGCQKSWLARRLEAKADAILTGLNRWLVSRAWCKDQGDYIPAPLTWLNQERWLIEEIPEADPGDQPAILRRAITDAEARAMLGDAP